jgi:hypothetical protein
MQGVEVHAVIHAAFYCYHMEWHYMGTKLKILEAKFHEILCSV